MNKKSAEALVGRNVVLRVRHKHLHKPGHWYGENEGYAEAIEGGNLILRDKARTLGMKTKTFVPIAEISKVVKS